MVEATMTPGEYIDFFRNRHKINQGKLAREVCVGTQSVVDFEKGRLTLDNLRDAILRLSTEPQELKEEDTTQIEATMTQGEFISFLRSRHKLRQIDVAKELGVVTQSIIDFEKGRLTLDNLRNAILRLSQPTRSKVTA